MKENAADKLADEYFSRGIEPVITDMMKHVYECQDDLPEHLRDHFLDEETVSLPWPLFHHPVYVSMFPLVLPQPIEDFINWKLDWAREKLNKGNTFGYLWAFERAYRMRMLLQMRDEGVFDTKKKGVEFWQLARNVWIDAEHDEEDPVWEDLITSDVEARWAMTESKDRRALRNMPDKITVHRGISAVDRAKAEEGTVSGWQWTLKHKTARFFARRFLHNDDQPFVATAVVPKDLVVAYLTMRNEAEILIDPCDVEHYDIEIVQLNSRKHEKRDTV